MRDNIFKFLLANAASSAKNTEFSHILFDFDNRIVVSSDASYLLVIYMNSSVFNDDSFPRDIAGKYYIDPRGLNALAKGIGNKPHNINITLVNDELIFTGKQTTDEKQSYAGGDVIVQGVRKVVEQSRLDMWACIVERREKKRVFINSLNDVFFSAAKNGLKIDGKKTNKRIKVLYKNDLYSTPGGYEMFMDEYSCVVGRGDIFDWVISSCR